jgi:protein involved in polysaccharide export with SLBB domain
MFLSGDRSKDYRLENGDTVFVPVVGPVAAVAGEVKRPAIYELKGKTTLWQLLSMAGGTTAVGNMGRVQVERFDPNAGRIVSDLDLQLGKDDPASAGLQVMDRDMIKIFPVMQAMRQVVMLQGNVVRPGEYQYRKGMRMSDLLPSFTALLPDAYLEAAQIIRLLPPDFHRETISVNLGKVLDGDPQENIALQEQDTVKVFSRMDMVDKPTVAINGMVVNPGEYDYFPNMTIRDLVSASGSLKRNAFMDKAELTRIILDKGVARAKRFDIDLGKAMAGDPQHNLTIHQDDILIVRGIQEWLESSERFMTIQGEVRFPGTYSITKGERLSSVIKRAGGFNDKAYMKGARFFRKSVQRDQQKRMEEFIQRAEQDIMKKQGELSSVAASREELEATKAALEGLQKNLERLKTLKAEGRVVISLSHIDKFINSPSDVEVQGGDLLNIPLRSSVVNVLGQVYNQTSFIYKPGESLSYYLEHAGGTTGDAEKSDMYIISADGSVFSRQQSSFGIKWDDSAGSWNFGSFMATPLQPGDTVVVPQKLERTAWLRDIKDITQILANVALTAGTILIGLR